MGNCAAPGEITPSTTRTETAVSASMLTEWIELLVNNCYVKFAGGMRRQREGLPMGESCSWSLGQLLLVQLHMRRSIEARHYRTVEPSLSTRRYIDDIGTWNNP